VFQKLAQQLRSELDGVERMAAAARDEVGSAESKQEGKYDTRATEASYLARGQAERVVALRRLVGWVDIFTTSPSTRAEVGALVHVEPGGWLFMAPDGGHQVSVRDVVVRVVSPRSPLGRAMAGLREDDSFEVDTPNGEVSYDILAVT
jgi:hypothetical protein